MRTALVIGTMLVLVSACVDEIDNERGRSSSTGPEHGDAGSPSSRNASRHVSRVTPPSTAPSDAFAVEDQLAAAADAQDAGPDDDAGADAADSEYERAIVYDCTETVQCKEQPGNNIPRCVVSVREVLNAASPKTRQVFLRGVTRCRPKVACEYVDCANN